MKVVLAGGTGLIGRALSEGLARRGDEVVVLSRSADCAVRGARLVSWRPPELDGWAAELRGADAVVNLAGESVGHWPWTPSRRRRLRDSRLVPTSTLVRAIAALPSKQRPRVLVSASGTDLYEGRDEQPADESTPPADTFLAHLCQDWEAAALQAEPLGLRVALARISLVVAPDAPSLAQVALPFRFFVGGPIGSGQQWVSWIDLGDAVRLLMWSLDDSSVHGPLNLAAPDPRPQAAFAAAVGDALHRPHWFRTPTLAVQVLMGEAAILALGSRRVWPRLALNSGFSFAAPRLEDSLANAFRSS